MAEWFAVVFVAILSGVGAAIFTHIIICRVLPSPPGDPPADYRPADITPRRPGYYVPRRPALV